MIGTACPHAREHCCVCAPYLRLWRRGCTSACTWVLVTFPGWCTPRCISAGDSGGAGVCVCVGCSQGCVDAGGEFGQVSPPGACCGCSQGCEAAAASLWVRGAPGAALCRGVSLGAGCSRGCPCLRGPSRRRAGAGLSLGAPPAPPRGAGLHGCPRGRRVAPPGGSPSPQAVSPGGRGPFRDRGRRRCRARRGAPTAAA